MADARASHHQLQPQLHRSLGHGSQRGACEVGVKLVTPAATEDGVAAALAIQLIRATAAIDVIVAIKAVDHVVPGLPENPVIPARGIDIIVSAAGKDDIIPQRAVDIILRRGQAAFQPRHRQFIPYQADGFDILHA